MNYTRCCIAFYSLSISIPGIQKTSESKNLIRVFTKRSVLSLGDLVIKRALVLLKSRVYFSSKSSSKLAENEIILFSLFHFPLAYLLTSFGSAFKFLDQTLTCAQC